MRTGHRINLQRPIRLTVFWLVAAVLLSVSNAAHAQEAQSLLEYAADDFFGGAVVRLDKLRKSDRHLLLPLDALLPSGISLDRVSNSVDQFVVFVKDGADLVSPPRLPEQYELAAVAEFSQPVTKQSANEAIARLNSGVTGTQANIDVLTDSFRIGQTTCYRVDSGTIFHSRNRHGSLSFLDRKGKATKKGINVGDYVPRGYIEGQTKAKAIFHFDQLSASDLIGDKLTLDLRLDVFPIGRRFRDYIRARIYLRSSDGKLESEPVALKARSHGRYLVEFSRQLSVVDQNARPN